MCYYYLLLQVISESRTRTLERLFHFTLFLHEHIEHTMNLYPIIPTHPVGTGHYFVEHISLDAP